MSLEDFGKLWIASSDLTASERTVRKLLDLGADTVVLKTAVQEPAGGKNYVVKNGIIIYYDFSEREEIERLIHSVPYFLEDAVEGGFLEGFRVIPEPGSVSSYTHGGDQKALSIEASNQIYKSVKNDYPDRHIVQSLGISCREDFNLVDILDGDGVELNLRYAKSQSTPIVIPNSPIMTLLLGLEEEVEEYHQNLKDIYKMTAEYSDYRKKDKPILLKLERQSLAMDYMQYYELDFDGFTCFDSGNNIIANHDERVGFRLINKGKTSGMHLLPGTLATIQKLRSKNEEKYISASGGIVKPQDVLYSLMSGADSIQLCSAIYLNDISIVRDFARARHFRK